MMAFTLYPREMSQVPDHDPAFMEAINKNMSVPERLSVSLGQKWCEEKEEEAMGKPKECPPAYIMQIPDRLTYTEAADMSPRPLFTVSKPTSCGPLELESCWETQSGEVSDIFDLQSPIRRSYSDQSFARAPPGKPPQLKQASALPRSNSENRSPEKEAGTAVEFIILRRQIIKMSHRLASLEKHSIERRNTDVILFSLLFSACLLNAWLWIRR